MANPFNIELAQPALAVMIGNQLVWASIRRRRWQPSKRLADCGRSISTFGRPLKDVNIAQTDDYHPTAMLWDSVVSSIENRRVDRISQTACMTRDRSNDLP